MIRLLYLVTILICALPLIPGVLGIVLPALSWLPALGLYTPSFSAFNIAFQWSGLSQSIFLTLFTGIGSTVLAIALCFFILRANWNSPRWQRIEHLIAPMLALPHVAFAIGFAFTFAPTGWLFRLLESIGIDTSSAFTLIQDPYGIGLLFALAIKETPFLLLMSVSVLHQIRVNQLQAVAAGLGYNHNESWLKVVLPQWLPKMRMPIYAVLAYGLSVVDIALILGPTRPPTLAVLVWQWFNEPDLLLITRAAVGALLLLTVSFSVLALARAIEWLAFDIKREWQISGAFRYQATTPLTTKSNKRKRNTGISGRLHWPFFIIPIVVVPVLLLWSFAQRWRFPDILPSRYSARFWLQESNTLIELATSSAMLACISACLALILAIGCLEYRQKYQRGLPTWLIALPMVIPQLSILFGMQISTYFISGQYYWFWVIWSHVLFAFPYLYLSLDGPWRSYDIRLDQSARSLGMNAWATWWKVKRPLMMPAIWLAIAVGMSVSLAQYLPTQILGAGRISTLTTEAVALASGQDRRVSAVYGLLQGLLPLIFFTLALIASRYSGNFSRHKKSIQRQTRSTNTDDLICGKPHYK
ncbi:ABC transporter permease [Photobacterium indicum]|uniref:Thiamine ABC transporter permease n=1 Tax=Photobacterium indicum TaxID=81447 RepID=A0A2T3L9F8_9GAMM|nr:thiamine ABC transporter permease [Photobacterium indicum]PSV47636.1 thiamine ABC transporter permease [Photobacterium indicum]